MLLCNWMTKDVISVTADTSMLKASRLMKEHDIRRLPVLSADHKLIGIVSDRDIKAAQPSKATTLDAHELQYLLSEIKIKDIMSHNPVAIAETETVEVAAMIMEEKGFGGLPVLDANQNVVGIITDHDIFKVLIDVSGVKQNGIQLALLLPDTSGVLCEIFDCFKTYGANVFSVLTSRKNCPPNSSHVYIRLSPMPAEEETKLMTCLKQKLKPEVWVNS